MDHAVSAHSVVPSRARSLTQAAESRRCESSWLVSAPWKTLADCSGSEVADAHFLFRMARPVDSLWDRPHCITSQSGDEPTPRRGGHGLVAHRNRNTAELDACRRVTQCATTDEPVGRLSVSGTRDRSR